MDYFYLPIRPLFAVYTLNINPSLSLSLPLPALPFPFLEQRFYSAPRVAAAADRGSAAESTGAAADRDAAAPDRAVAAGDRGGATGSSSGGGHLLLPHLPPRLLAIFARIDTVDAAAAHPSIFFPVRGEGSGRRLSPNAAPRPFLAEKLSKPCDP